MSDVLAAVGSLADLMSSHGLTRLDLNLGSVAIRLRSDGNDEAPKQQLAVVETEALDAVEAPAAEGHFITAPMIGTYYAASAPSDPPFIQPGDWIEVGQVIGIIEAMKIMNEIVADRTGVVREILVQNAQAVEYGSPLVRIAE
ncbi:MAG: acetyl-CoA carboxylase biotin carboxyl carrier protein [Thermomicrobiales bacterium]